MYISGILVGALAHAVEVHVVDVVARAAARLDGRDEAREAHAAEVEAPLRRVVLAEQLAGDLRDAVHRRRPHRDVVADRVVEARAERRDRAREDHLLRPEDAGGLEDVPGPLHVHGVRAERDPLAGRRQDRGEVEDRVRLGRLHGVEDLFLPGDVALDPLDTRRGGRRGRGEVEGGDLVAAGEEEGDEVRADLAARTRDEDLHASRRAPWDSPP
jgi:hypothetical protein